MSLPKVNSFTIHGSGGFAVLKSKWLDWILERETLSREQSLDLVFEDRYGFGEATYYTWLVDSSPVSAPAIFGHYWVELPDASGFIVFESKRETDNCLLLNAFGMERMRLTVPVELTKRAIPKTNQMYFCNISAPWTEFGGKFGVHAWIEGSGSGGYLEGDWYFELDYHTGRFLWGREMRN